MEKVRMTREMRKRNVISVMKRAHDDGVSEMTAGYIARKMGLRPSTYVRQMIFELYLDGEISGRVVDTGSGVTSGIAYYWLPGVQLALFAFGRHHT